MVEAFSTHPSFSLPEPWPSLSSSAAATRPLRTLFPITSEEEEPIVTQPVFVPECGGRWGKPGNFAFSVAAQPDPNLSQFVQNVSVELWPDIPKETTRVINGHLTISRSAQGYKAEVNNCTADGGLDTLFATNYWVAKHMTFSAREESSKRHIWESNPITYWDYRFTFLDRAAYIGEFAADAPARDEGNKYLALYENDEPCTLQLQDNDGIRDLTEGPCVDQ